MSSDPCAQDNLKPFDVFPPPTLMVAEKEQLELALAEHAAQIFADTGLYLLCAVLDPSVNQELDAFLEAYIVLTIKNIPPGIGL